MKTTVKLILQKLLGLKTYLLIFSVFVIIKLRWDKKEKDFMQFLKLIPEGGFILDIGANIGVTTFYLAKRFPGSRVFSFEPVKINIDTLRSVVKLFTLKNVHPHEIALGNQNGYAEMVIPVKGKVKFHGLAYIVQDDTKASFAGDKYIVPMARLDDITEINNHNNHITGIKIDVENFEYQVLLGAKNLISEHRPVIYCELWENENRDKCTGFLKSLGYKPFVNQNKRLIPYNDLKISKNNFFFLPDIVSN